MKRYVMAYGAWAFGILAIAAGALAWYRYVEGITARELAARMTATDATEDTEFSRDEPAA